MDRCDFSSIMTCLKNHISESNQMNQPEFLYEVFEDFMDSPESKDFSFDNGLVCRWMTGQAKISPKICTYYARPSKQEKLAETLQHNLIPLMTDCNKALQDVYLLFMQDATISEAKKKKLAALYKPIDSRLLFLAKLISFGMERQFIKRDTRNQKLLAGGSLSPVILDYIMDSEVPRPCRHFLGREEELDGLHTMLEENSKVFLYGIAGIGKSELAKAYAKQYKKYYTNILYVEYAGDLHQAVTDMDFTDDLPEDGEEERFRKHNRFLRSLKKICLMHGTEVSYYKKLFQTVGNIMRMMEKDDLTKYLLFLEDVFPYMEKYRYRKGTKEIILEMKQLLKGNENGSATDRALLLDYQACMETKPEKAIKLEKEALAQIKEITEDNAHLVSNLHANLGGLYRMNGQAELAKEHMEKGIFLLEQYQLLYTNDSIPQINNYAALLTELQEPERAMAALQKLAQIIKEYNSDTCLNYAQVQESMGNICLITANISQAKTHFKKAMKIYENVWADEPELIEEKYQEIQELYPQVGIALARGILASKK